MTPSVAVDAVVISGKEVLLVQRGHPPFVGMWCLPGGFVEVGETTERAVVRELREETGLRGKVVYLVGVFSSPTRDPRGHNIGVAYAVSVGVGRPSPRGGDDARRARWWTLAALPPLAFDHTRILRAALAMAGASEPGGPPRVRSSPERVRER